MVTEDLPLVMGGGGAVGKESKISVVSVVSICVSKTITPGF